MDKFFRLLFLLFAGGFLLVPQVNAEIIEATNFSSGQPGTRVYEEFAFYLHDNGDAEIVYTYGADWKELGVDYIPATTKDNDSSFKVRFANDYTLNLIPKSAKLFVFDDAGNYAKEFTWQYKGPVDGRGTFCAVCLEESEAIEFIQENFVR